MAMPHLVSTGYHYSCYTSDFRHTEYEIWTSEIQSMYVVIRKCWQRPQFYMLETTPFLASTKSCKKCTTIAYKVVHV